MDKEQFPLVTFTMGTTPVDLIRERSDASPFHWSIQGYDARTLEACMGASAPSDGELTTDQLVTVLAALWGLYDSDDNLYSENAGSLRGGILECFNIEEV